MRKELISDVIPFVYSLEESKGGTYKLKGLFHLAEIKNANGRVYSRDLLKREVDKIQELVKNRQIVGELDHPTDPMIKLQNAAHVVTEVKMEGNKVFGVLEALGTPAGEVLKGLIESRVKLGISSRGVGTLKEEDGVKYVQEDFGLLTWDVVPNPSTPDAWLGENIIRVNTDSPVIEDSEIEEKPEVKEIEDDNKDFISKKLSEEKTKNDKQDKIIEEESESNDFDMELYLIDKFKDI